MGEGPLSSSKNVPKNNTNTNKENALEHARVLVDIVELSIQIELGRQHIREMDNRQAAKRRSDEITAVLQRHRQEEDLEKEAERASARMVAALRVKKSKLETKLP